MKNKKTALAIGIGILGLFGFTGQANATSNKVSANDELNRVDAVIYWKDTQGRYIGANEALRSMVGNDIVGKKDADIFTDKGFLDWIAKIDGQVIQTGKAVLNIHESAQDSKGKTVRVISNKYPVKDAHGKVIGMFGLSVPDTDAKASDPKFYLK